MLTLTIPKLYFPGNQPIANPITVALYIKDYYGGTYSLIDDNVPVDVDGTITSSPLPSTSIDPTQKYVLKAVNELCGFEYEQPVMIYPYCPIGQTLSEDASYCYVETFADATPPSAGENTVAVTNDVYTSCGTYIVDPGYNSDGTGASTQISLANPYWRNGLVLCGNNNLIDGPMNRCALWATTDTGGGQTVGFSVCINITESKTYMVGIACDNFGTIKLDGEVVVMQDEAAIQAQYSGIVGATFKFWFIYPLNIPAGAHYIELIGTNSGSAAALACQIYNNTPAEIAAATSDGDLNFIFNSADYVGQPIVLGSDGLGFSCPSGMSLATCQSPLMCVGIAKYPVLY